MILTFDQNIHKNREGTESNCTLCLREEAVNVTVSELQYPTHPTPFMGVSPMAQWVKNLTAVAQVAGEAQVGSPAGCSGLKEPLCCSRGAGHSYSLDLIPGPGTSTCHRYSH